jgi:hypothetical protein
MPRRCSANQLLLLGYLGAFFVPALYVANRTTIDAGLSALHHATLGRIDAMEMPRTTRLLVLLAGLLTLLVCTTWVGVLRGRSYCSSCISLNFCAHACPSRLPAMLHSCTSALLHSCTPGPGVGPQALLPTLTSYWYPAGPVCNRRAGGCDLLAHHPGPCRN